MEIRRPQTREEYILGLELAAPSAALMSLAPSELVLADDKPTAFVDAGSTVSFISGIPVERQQDVLNATLLAQLAANKKFDREKATEQWYGYYREVLENVGWVLQSFSFARYEESGVTLKMDKAALEIIAAIASGNEAAVLTSTLDALSKLDPGDPAFTLFDANGSSGEGGNFQLGTCSADPSGNVSMALGAFYFETTVHQGRFLFWSWETKDINLYTGGQNVVLNEQIYATVRQLVIDKLGDRAKTFVAGLDI